MEKTKIEWCDSSWNPVSGCYNNCPYCYARATANRFKGCDDSPEGITPFEVISLPDRLKVTSKDGTVRNAAYPYGFTPTLHEYRLDDPYTKGFGKTIFVCSMADLFGNWVPDEWIERVFESCKKADNHRYLFLTKNPARYLELASAGKLPTDDIFWYGSTVTTPAQDAFFSDKHHTFLSIEPILAPFGETDGFLIKNTEWVIFGAETGTRKDKVVPEKSWIDSAVSECKKYNKPVFMKDSLTPIFGDNLITEFPWDD